MDVKTTDVTKDQNNIFIDNYATEPDQIHITPGSTNVILMLSTI